MLDTNEVNETAIGTEGIAASPLAALVQSRIALLALKTKLLTEIGNAGPFQEALEITMRPPRPRKEAVAVLNRYVRELSAAKEAEWRTNGVVGLMAGYFIMRQFTEIDPRDGIAKGRLRTTLLLNPNPLASRRHQWLNSVYWPNLSCDIDGNRYFRRNVFISLKVVKDNAEIALEISNAFSDPPMLMALGSFDRLGLTSVWVKPYGNARRLPVRQVVNNCSPENFPITSCF
jgi:hypothetical protein